MGLFTEDKFMVEDKTDTSQVLEQEKTDKNESHKLLLWLLNSKMLNKASSLFVCLSLIFSICVFIQCAPWLVSKKMSFYNKNIYSGNELNISDDELHSIIDVVEEQLGSTIDEEYYDDYCLLNAIIENKNLTDEEKNIFYGAIDIIKDNPYINKEAAYKSLLDIDVLYTEHRPFFVNSADGIYNSMFKKIGVFEEDERHLILRHEMIHAIFSNKYTRGLPTYFEEGMTELLSNEYFAINPYVEYYHYPFEIAMVKMLCEVSSPDAVLEAYSTGNMTVIAKEMANITKDEDAAIKALKNVKSMMQQYNSLDKDDKENIINGFIPMFREIVNTKADLGLQSSDSYYYNEMLLMSIFEENSYDCYKENITTEPIDTKGYFNSKLKYEGKGPDKIEKVKMIK